MKKIINFYCDASIDAPLKIACAAYSMSVQDFKTQQVLHSYEDVVCTIENNATNNSAEILAILTAVNKAAELYQKDNNILFRIFSDSRISIFGLREWIPSWIKNMNDNILYSSQGNPVLNQQRFIQVFNTIVSNDMKVEFYHQRGHVLDHKSTCNINDAKRSFIHENGIAPEYLGVDMEYLCKYNDLVDNTSRAVLYDYINQRIEVPCENITVIGEDPMTYFIRADKVKKYLNLIDRNIILRR